jgi:hypothetical protein
VSAAVAGGEGEGLVDLLGRDELEAGIGAVAKEGAAAAVGVQAIFDG